MMMRRMMMMAAAVVVLMMMITTKILSSLNGMMMTKIMGHLLFDLLDFLKKRQSVFHEVFSGHILWLFGKRNIDGKKYNAEDSNSCHQTKFDAKLLWSQPSTF